MSNSQLASDYEKFLLSSDRVNSKALLDKAYSSNGFTGVEEIICMTLESIGEKWENGEISLAQVYLTGMITEEIIKVYLNEDKDNIKGEPQIGICVLLDHHGLGKRLVISVLRANGYQVVDFGNGLDIEDIVGAVRANPVDVLLVSTLMVSSALKIEMLQKELKQEFPNIKIIPGGAPFRLNEDLWKKVGADANGGTAANVINAIREAMGDNNE